MIHLGHIPASIHPQGCQVCGFPAELDYFFCLSVGKKKKKKVMSTGWAWAELLHKDYMMNNAYK